MGADGVESVDSVEVTTIETETDQTRGVFPPFRLV